MRVIEDEIITTQIAALYQIISAPLIATIDADIMAARKFVEFIEEYGFEKKTDAGSRDAGNEHFGKLKFTTFRYQTETGETRFVKIPTLSLIPLPALQVKEAYFDFEIRIIGAVQETKVTVPSLTEDVKPLSSKKARGSGELLPLEPPILETEDVSRRVMATMSPLGSSEKEHTDLSPNLVANMKVRINFAQSDMPAGISALLNIMGDSVSGKELDREVVLSGYNFVITPQTVSNPIDIQITALDYIGKPIPDQLINVILEPVPAGVKGIEIKDLEVYAGTETGNPPTPTRASVISNKEGIAGIRISAEGYGTVSEGFVLKFIAESVIEDKETRKNYARFASASINIIQGDYS